MISSETAGPRSSLRVAAPNATVLGILLAISFSHLLNDSIQALIPSIYPLLKQSYHLDFAQVGIITLAFQCTASILQPVVGFYTDRRPLPYSLAWGMGITLVGLALFSRAGSFPAIVFCSAFVGVGSAVFHPESSRVAHMASGGRHGFAQSLFQVGGNAGGALGPLLAALIIVPGGQARVLWFCLMAFAGILILWRVGAWYGENRSRIQKKPRSEPGRTGLPRGRVPLALAVLALLIFSKYFYLVSLTNYYTFYLITKFHVSIPASQVYLFVFLFAVAAGTLIGGPAGDRFGRKVVIWVSIVGVAPFTLALPYAGLWMTCVLSVVIGLVLSSAFSAILVYAQELVPGNVGMIAGIFFGWAFGMAGIGAAALGWLADRTSIGYVFHICSFLPLIGLLTGLLPNVGAGRDRA